VSDVLVQGLAGIALAVVAVGLAWRLGLGLSKELAVAATRAVVQLTAVGAVIVVIFEVPALAFAYVFRDVFLSDRSAAIALTCGIGFFALSTFADLTSLKVEEWLELVAGLWIAAGLVLMIRTHLKQNLQIRVGVVGRSAADEAPQPALPAKVPAGTP